jgi:hypothetical protein
MWAVYIVTIAPKVSLGAIGTTSKEVNCVPLRGGAIRAAHLRVHEAEALDGRRCRSRIRCEGSCGNGL